MAAHGALHALAVWLLVHNWPADQVWAMRFFAMVTFAVTSGVVVHMARCETGKARLILSSTAIGLVFAALAWRIASLQPPEKALFEGDEILARSGFLVGIVVLYIVGPFIQLYVATGTARFPYAGLHERAWSNFFIACLGGLYMVLFWVVLGLWAQLFTLVEIDLFRETFRNGWFAFPFTGAALGYGLAVARESESIVVTLRTLSSRLLTTLLPLVAVVTVAFLATLVVVGVQHLLDTHSTASLVAAWCVVYFILLNGVYEDGSNPPPYGPAVCRVIEGAILVMPVFVVLAGYALELRIAEYGLMPERVFAVAGIVLLGMYSVGYAIAALVRGKPWLPRIRTANIAMCPIVVAVGIALHLPVLDPVRLSVDDQLRRLKSGAVPIEKFDFGALRFSLGRNGFEALADLERDGAPGDVKLLHERIARVRSAQNRRQLDKREWLESGALVAADNSPPVPVDFLEDLKTSQPLWQSLSCTAENPCRALLLDVDGDGTEELLVATTSATWFYEMPMFKRDQTGTWTTRGAFRVPPAARDVPALADAFRRGDVHPTAPLIPDLLLGDQRLNWAEREP
ncbi:MAG TPA: hypothetical protein VN634_14735 [Candidatus Limnocylindrales bacterium]|nr:hypothetical protein [Candidatus Limnocylindrales bacterium]